VPDIQQIVNGAFYGSTMVKPTKAVTVDVYNGSGTPGLAEEAAQVFATAAGTQSVNSVLFGAQPEAPGRPMTNPAPQSSKHVGSSADGVTVPANARYGIPCVY
jgi:hypothetical protein